MKRPVIVKKKHLMSLDQQLTWNVTLGNGIATSNAPSSKFLGNFLDVFPELTIEQGRKIVSYWMSIMDNRPAVKAAYAEVAADRFR